METIVLEGAGGEGLGPTLVVLGGVHGNEPCGPVAIRRMINDIRAGHVRLQVGKLVCVPAVNTLALERNQRFIDANLNRIMGAPDPETHEGRLVPALRAVLDGADYLLDLHSYSAGGPPFVFAATDAATMAFAQALPAAAIVTGWEECYRRAYPAHTAPGIGTTEYARSRGCVAVTFECGQHYDRMAPDAGYNALVDAMAHAGLIAARGEIRNAPPHYRMQNVFVKERDGAFARTWTHLHPIRTGEPFARFADGTVQQAKEDGVVILPFEKTPVGTEWGYLARSA